MQDRESVERWNGEKHSIVRIVRKNPGLALREAENLSYGQLMRFDIEIVDGFFKLLRQRVNTMKLHQRLLLLYEVDDTGFQLPYSSGNQKLLAVKGSTRVHSAADEENR
jgi:hypothetical protein